MLGPTIVSERRVFEIRSGEETTIDGITAPVVPKERTEELAQRMRGDVIIVWTR